MFTTKQCTHYSAVIGGLASAFFAWGFGISMAPAGIAIGAFAWLLFYIAY